MDEQLFRRLSADLIGDDSLSPAVAATLLKRLTEAANPASLAQLAAVATTLPTEPAERLEAIRNEIMIVPALRELAKFIILLWYTGDLPVQGAAPPTENEYFGGHLWTIIRAHPPGLSGGYFGHWAYLPDV